MLEEAIEYCDDQPYSNRQEKLFDYLMEVYVQSGNDMKAVGHHVGEIKGRYEKRGAKLLGDRYNMESLTKKSMILQLAESLIIAAARDTFY